MSDVRAIQQQLNTAEGDDTRAFGAAPPMMKNGWSQAMNPLDNIEVIVIAFNIPFSDDEYLGLKARDIVSSLGEQVSSDVRIIAVARLRRQTTAVR